MDTPRMKNMLNSRGRVLAAGAVALLLAGSTVAVLTRDDGVQDSAVVSSLTEERTDSYPASSQMAPMMATSGGSSGGGRPARDDASVRAGAAAPVPDARFAPPSGPAPHDRVVRTGSIQLSVDKGGFRAAFDRVVALATELGGFVASSGSERVDGELASGRLSLRIPSDRFETARTRLATIGKVDQESIGGEDVGGQLVDLDARLRSLRAQEDALRTLLGRAKTVGEVIQVQEQLGNTRQQIEQLAAQEASLKDRVSFATFEVVVAEPGAAVAPPSGSVLARSWERAVGGSLAVVAGCIVVLGYAAPLVVLALIAFGIYRLANQRRRVAAVEAEAAAST